MFALEQLQLLKSNIDAFARDYKTPQPEGLMKEFTEGKGAAYLFVSEQLEPIIKAFEWEKDEHPIDWTKPKGVQPIESREGE